MTDFNPERLTEPEIDRISQRVLAILREEKLSPLEYQYLWIMVNEKIEKELERNNC